MEESAQSRGEAVEQGGRDGVDEVPGPEDHAGCDGNDRGRDDVDHTPFDVGFANCGRLVFFSLIKVCAFRKARKVERRPCAGIIRYTFIRLKRSLPLSHNGPRVRKRYYMVRRVSRLVFHMSAKVVKWTGSGVFPKVLGLRENTEPIDMRESRCRDCICPLLL